MSSRITLFSEILLNNNIINNSDDDNGEGKYGHIE